MLGAGVVGIEKRLRFGRTRVRISSGEKDFIFYRKFREALGAHPASYSISVMVILSRNTAGPEVNHLPPSSAEMSGVRRPVPLYDFMAWTGKTLKLSFTFHSFSILSDDRSNASSKTVPPYSAI
jgi:hypothetical protein